MLGKSKTFKSQDFYNVEVFQLNIILSYCLAWFHRCETGKTGLTLAILMLYREYLGTQISQSNDIKSYYLDLPKNYGSTCPSADSYSTLGGECDMLTGCFMY